MVRLYAPIRETLERPPEGDLGTSKLFEVQKLGGLGGNRTPDALLRTEALYPLSYEAAEA